MVSRMKARLRLVDASELNFMAFAAAFMATWALLAALWQIGLSAQMHFAPACNPDDTVRLACTYTASAKVTAVTPDTIGIRGDGFLTNAAYLPLWADVSFLDVGDSVTAVEWHGHIASLTRHGRTLNAMGSPDAGPVAWPGVLVFFVVMSAIAWMIRRLAKRRPVTLTASLRHRV